MGFHTCCQNVIWLRKYYKITAGSQFTQRNLLDAIGTNVVSTIYEDVKSK